jgi:head-tail adaptor
MLSAGELAAMRETAETALPGTAVVSSLAFASDSGGEGTATWTPSGTVDCRIAPIRGTEREMGDRISADAEYVVTLPSDVTITTDSRVAISGTNYSVEAIRDRSWNLTTRVEVTKET